MWNIMYVVYNVCGINYMWNIMYAPFIVLAFKVFLPVLTYNTSFQIAAE